MQNESRGVFSTLENYLDMLINLIAFIVSYVLVLMIDEPKIEILHPVTIAILFLNLLASSFVYHTMNLYRPTRYIRPFRSLPEILKVNLVYFGILMIISVIVTRPGYKHFVLFWVIFSFLVSTAFLTFKRHAIRAVLYALREKKYNLRKVIIIGDNTATAAQYIKEVDSGAEYGAMVIGFVGDKIDGSELGVEKLGKFRDLAKILDKYRPTDAVFAIEGYDKRHLIPLVNMCDDRCIKVYFLPVIYGFFKTSRQIEQVGSVPLINIHSTPLDNPANAAMKRALDIIGSLALIILTLPIMIFAAIGVYLSSPGPILFKQHRVGRLGKRFTMLKFRSMRVNTESNAAWTTDEDPRKTKFGTFLRRTSIDELPQLFNVLGGSMSLVGPRPEIPVFVEHFKEIIPLYMVKHYVKPGITGLAQIKGLRGDTSVEDRIHEDIEYIENWSFMLDLSILLKTPFKAINKHEKYVAPEENTSDSAEIAQNENALDKADTTPESAVNDVAASTKADNAPTAAEPEIKNEENRNG